MSSTVVSKATIKKVNGKLTGEFQYTTDNDTGGWTSFAIVLDEEAGVIHTPHDIYRPEKKLVDGEDSIDQFVAEVWLWLSQSFIATSVSKKTLAAVNAVNPLGAPRKWGYNLNWTYTQREGWRVDLDKELSSEEVAAFRKELDL